MGPDVTDPDAVLADVVAGSSVVIVSVLDGDVPEEAGTDGRTVVVPDGDGDEDDGVADVEVAVPVSVASGIADDEGEVRGTTEGIPAAFAAAGVMKRKAASTASPTRAPESSRPTDLLPAWTPRHGRSCGRATRRGGDGMSRRTAGRSSTVDRR